MPIDSVPLLQGRQRVVRAGVGQAEHGENLVADVFLDGAVAGEDLVGHALVELAQHRQHGLGRHRLGHAREADDVGEQHRHGLAPHRPERLVLLGQQVNDAGREITRQVGTRPLGLDPLLVEHADVGDGLERLVDRELEVVEVDRLGDEVEGAAVHRGADIGHVAVGRDDHRPGGRPSRAQLGQERQPVHHRHVDVEQQQADVGLGRQHRQRFLAVAGEAEGEVTLADALAEALLEQQLEVRLVVDREDLGRLAHGEGRSCSRCCLSRPKSTGLVTNSKAPYSLALRRRSSSP